MNILLINHYAGSKFYGMEYRAYYLAKEWVKQGHQVTIVAATFSHLRLKNPVIKKDYQSEIIDGIKYVWLKTPAYVGSLKRILNMGTFVYKVNKYAKRLTREEKPGLVIAGSCYPLDNYVAHRIAKLSGAKYTYEVRDIWPLSPKLIGGYSDYHPFIWVMQKAEDYAYKHVDKVVSLLWNAEKHCREHGLPEGRFVCVPNGYNPDEWTEEKFTLPLPDIHKRVFDDLKGKIIIGFAGGFAASGALDTVLKAAEVLREREDIHFVMVGKGPEESNFRKFIEERELKNVTLLPAVPKELVPSILSHFDITPICGGHSPLHQYGSSPNKLTDCMLSSLPIIYSVDEPGCLVERVGCGYRIEAENIEEMVDAITRLSDMSTSERRAIGEKGMTYAHEKLKWSTLAEEFVNSFK